MNALEQNNKNKMALLQGRLGIPSADENIEVLQSIKVNSEKDADVATEDTPVVIDICEGSDEKPEVDWPKSLLRYEEHSNSNSSKHMRDSNNNEDGKKENTPKRQKHDGAEPSPDGNSRGAVTGMRKLETYFQYSGPTTFAATNKSFSSSSKGTGSTATSASSSSNAATSGVNGATPTNTSTQNISTTSSSQHNEKTAAAIAAMTADFKKQNEQLRMTKDQYEQKAQRLDSEMKSALDRIRKSEERNCNLTKSLEEVYRRMAFEEARRKRDRLALDNVRLGKIQTVRTSATSLGDVWEEGYALKELTSRATEVSIRREELEKRRNRLKAVKRKFALKQSSQNDANNLENNASLDSSVGGDGFVNDSSIELEIITEESALRTHMDQLRRDESALAEARHLLDAEKAAHQKEVKRCQSEDHSRFFKDLPCLNKRYLLLSMLGKGGFSEVWKALDLSDLREVAVKIHQLNPTWSEARRQSYVKHVTREYTIHRDLNHPRVVMLFDVFEIDVNSFATVLELCHGTDLDEKLKTQKIIPEKDAKTILMQIIFGLRYLNGGSTLATPLSNNSEENVGNVLADRGGSPSAMPPPNAVPRRRSIIHFDLKPANILFDSMGDVKITDFGLSKILDEADEGMTSVELTSQGAGTYWYLPPECFDRGDAPPRISSKVDVWSLGVILFQMLYGKRPFGEGKSQERILTEGIVLNATRVEFPNDFSKGNGTNSSSSAIPKVSEEAKDFIRACLTWDQRHRPDVFQLCQHPYLKPVSKKS